MMYLSRKLSLKQIILLPEHIVLPVISKETVPGALLILHRLRSGKWTRVHGQSTVPQIRSLIRQAMELWEMPVLIQQVLPEEALVNTVMPEILTAMTI